MCSTERGFTLIEMLVVMTLVVAVSSLVVPDLWTVYLKSNDKRVLQEFSNTVLSRKIEAFREGKLIVFSKRKRNEYILYPTLPAGWVIVKAPLLYFFPTGLTSGAEMTLKSSDGLLWRLKFTPIDGEVNIEKLP